MWVEIIVAIIGISVAAKMFPQFILLSKFAYCNAKFSAVPNDYIKEKEIARLLESKNLEELKNNVVSRDFVLEGNDAGEIQKSIDASLVRIIKMAKNDSPPTVGEFYDAYLQKMDGEIFKKAIRDIIEGKKIEGYTAYSEKGRMLMEGLKKMERDEVENFLEKNFSISLSMPLEKIEREIDRIMLRNLRETRVPKSSRKALEKFTGIMVDVMNLKTILRGKHYGREGIEEHLLGGGWEIYDWKLEELLKIDSVAEIISMLEGTSYMHHLGQAINEYEKKGVVALERALDRYMIKAAGDMATEHYMGIGPGIRFLVEKEYEARNLKVVAKAIEADMREEAWDVVVVI